MADLPARNLVCRCYFVDEDTIRKAIAEHRLQQVEEVTAVTRAGGGCSSCWDEIQAILSGIWGKPLPRDVADASGLSSAQKRGRIVTMLEAEVFPLLDLNRIQMQLVDVTGDRALARFTGNGVGTTAASFLALKRYVVQKMTEACGQKMNLVELNVLEALAP
ncbi:MAG TPA: (2Fe-2S)-binding protein [Planctomycetota bacterium]|nr:(2Fe-2S)-binding protein [Planctomycetota bacterium]